jgi:SAM-dependent methyltransferase
MTMPDFETSKKVLQYLFEEDHKWFLPTRRTEPSPYLGYTPYQLADFIGVLSEITREASGNKFLDIGCGPGVKMKTAQFLFGYSVDGIEVNEDMAFAAATLNTAEDTDVWNEDALIAGTEGPRTASGAVELDYSRYDVIWLYRPFANPELESDLEQRIFAEMKEGAILAGGGWENRPPGSWNIVVDDFDLNRGAYSKLSG